MKLLIIAFALIFLLSCEKFQTHHYVCEYLRTNTFTGDTIVNIPLDSMMGKDDLTEDQIKAWMAAQRDIKYELNSCGDTVWITNKIHCMELTCVK
jgi:hypothetical protein